MGCESTPDDVTVEEEEGWGRYCPQKREVADAAVALGKSRGELRE